MSMDKQFKAADLLRAFQWIYDHGTPAQDNDGRNYGPVKASVGFDGYTVTLANSHAAVTVNFHNTLVFSTHDKDALESLHRDIDAVAEAASSN